MTKWLILPLLPVAAVVGSLYVWVYAPQQHRLEKALREASTWAQEAASLRSRVRELDETLGSLDSNRTPSLLPSLETGEEVAALRDAEDQLVAALEPEIRRQEIRITSSGNRLKVELLDEALFESGEASLMPAGEALLRNVGEAFRSCDRHRVEVQGLTASTSLTDPSPGSWGLSTERAVRVARFLGEETGVPLERLSAGVVVRLDPEIRAAVRGERTEIWLAAPDRLATSSENPNRESAR